MRAIAPHKATGATASPVDAIRSVLLAPKSDRQARSRTANAHTQARIPATINAEYVGFAKFRGPVLGTSGSELPYWAPATPRTIAATARTAPITSLRRA
ncbi:hypothetical protein MICABA_01783 [Microbacterium sp. T2.11-28]|nr:hypothetical protein MICABA_01783 [Microbacterium sp. T2.11-28]